MNSKANRTPGTIVRVPSMYRGDVPFVVAVEEQFIEVESQRRDHEHCIELDGREMTTLAGVFSELGSKVHLHSYLGRNWDALPEALWTIGGVLDADRVVLLVRHAQEVGSLEAGSLGLFIDVVCHAIEMCGGWCNDEGEVEDMRLFSLRVLLSLDEGKFGEFAAAVEAISPKIEDWYGAPLGIVRHGPFRGFEALSITPEARGFSS